MISRPSPVIQKALVRFSGVAQEDDKLAQLNLALVFETSNLPFYYRKLAGNIPDSKTLKSLLNELDVLGFSKVKLVMDRGSTVQITLTPCLRTM